jgi:hypothetical protein
MFVSIKRTSLLIPDYIYVHKLIKNIFWFVKSIDPTLN